MEAFARGPLGSLRDAPLTVLDVGSQIVMEGHRTYRHLFDSPNWQFIGLDVEAGLNVDVAVANAYEWDEIAADSVDVVISGQALEHVPMFWLTMFEIGRVLKPGGVTMLIAPSGGFEHRFPVDCWRIYADGMSALCTYLDFELVEYGTDWKSLPWADSWLVMRKPQWSVEQRQHFLRRREHQLSAAFPQRRWHEPAPGPLPRTSPCAGLSAPVIAPHVEVLHDHEALAVLNPPLEVAPPGEASAVTWRQVAGKFVGRRGRAVVRRLRRS
jgi:SAM-dependent methyltransferase